MFQGILDFIESLLTVVISIIEYLISALDGFLTFIIELPSTLGSLIETCGGVLTMVFGLFSNLPNNLWLGVMIVFAGRFLVFLMWENNKEQ